MYGAAAGALLSAYGSMKQGQDQASTLDYQAKVQTQNANAAMVAAKLNADKQQMQFKKLQGTDIANYGASGVSQDSGSVLSVLASNAAGAEIDRQNILYGGQVRAINFENQASMDKVASNRASEAGFIGTLGNLFKGGADIYKTQYGQGGGGYSGEGSVSG